MALPLAAVAPAQEDAATSIAEAAVDRELRLRAGAAALGARADDLSFADVRAATEPVLAPDRWVEDVALLDLAARTGRLVRGTDALPDPNDRPELWAAQLRVAAADPDAAALAGWIAEGLGSRFRTVREAAHERLVRALVDDDALRPHLAQIVEAAAPSGPFAASVAASIARSGAAAGGVEAAWSAQESSDVEGSPIDALFDDWVRGPFDAAAIDRLRARAADGERALVESLALVAVARDRVSLSSPPEIDAVVRWIVDGTDEERLDRVTRAAGSDVLGRALLGRAADPEIADDARLRCARGAAWSLSMSELLSGAADLDDDTALEIWDVVGLRSEALDADVAAAFVFGAEGEVREAAAREIGRRYVLADESHLGATVARLLDDPSPDVRTLAFAWLCDAPDADRFGDELRRAYDAEEEPDARLSGRQKRWLARLPRDESVSAFRDVVIDLVEDPATREPTVIELLATFDGDPESSALASAVLAESVAVIVAEPTYLGRLRADSDAAAAARVLHRRLGTGAVEAIVDALSRSAEPMNGEASRDDARPQLPKTAAGLLGRTDAGRRRLPAFLGDDVPRRVRFEAALQLAKFTRDDPALARRVGERLVADFDGVDGTLRMRAVAALGALGAPPEPDGVTAFLERLAQPGTGDGAERLAAIEALGERGNARALLRLVEGVVANESAGLDDLAAASIAARALGPTLARDETTRAALGLDRAVAAELERDDLPELRSISLVELRGALLGSLVLAHGRLGEADGREVLGEVLERPLAAARSDLGRRFDGEDLADARFRWRAELEAFERVAGSPDLVDDVTSEVARQGRSLSELDGRLQLVLGDLVVTAAPGDQRGLELLSSGLFAVAGEPPSREAARDLALGRAALGRASLTAAEVGGGTPGQWRLAALQAALLVVDVRRERVRRTLLDQLIGTDDPTIPRDAEARLVALARTFRGRAALAEGDLVGARAWATAADRWARLDVGASEELTELKAAIDAAGR
ncbi:MAG: hypothetical protein AAGA20_06805 [Planctomycetota bacterium]